MMKRAFAVMALSSLLLGEPVFAQGEKETSPIAAAGKLKPGEWVLAPEIAPQGPIVVVVDLTRQLAFIYRNGVAIGVSTISSGKAGYETPTGVFQILQKDADHRSSTYNNAPMPYQERLTWDGVALHAGGLPGYPESHGCIHLPYEFAKKIFDITKMGGTVVVEGSAGSPVTTKASGILAPVDESGDAMTHHYLSGDSTWNWIDAVAKEQGPLSIVISSSDGQLIAMRGGKVIGRSRAEIDGAYSGTHVATMKLTRDGTREWILLGVPGNESEANRPIDTKVLERLRLPQEFRDKLRPAITEGTTVLVTSASIGADSSGKRLTVLNATSSEE